MDRRILGDSMSWFDSLKASQWVGFCNACNKWRNEEMSREQNGKYYCTKRTNYLGKQGDAEMYRREMLERLDGLGWDRRKVNGRDVCGMELADGDEHTDTDRETTDFRGRGDIPGA